MGMKKRWITGWLTAALVCGLLAPSGGLVQKAEAASVTETLFPSNAVDGLKLQTKDFEHNGSMQKDATLAMNFKTESSNHITSSRYSEYGQYLGSGSYYPEGHNYYRSSDFEVADSWHRYLNWYPSTEQMEVLDTLITSANTLQIGGRYDGYYDTQAGKNAGQVWMRIAQAKSGARIADAEKKISTDVKKATFHAQTLAWVTLKDDDSFTHFELDLGATEGASGALVDDKNHARFANPEFYIRDITSPKIESITVKDNGYNKNYTAGDTVTVEVVFSEPIRVENYDSAFSLNGSGLDTFKVSAYSDYTQTVTFTTEVRDDRNQQISAGNFSLSLNCNPSYITDLAGNALDSASKTKTASDSNVIISGYIPRINAVKYSYAQIRDSEGEYHRTNSVQGSVKEGDVLYIDLYFNQYMYSPNGGRTASQIRVNVGNKVVNANLYGVYKDNTALYEATQMDSTNGLVESYTFNRLQYSVKIPNGVDDNAEIRLAAEKNGSCWELTDNDAWLSTICGNMILTNTSKRQTANARTEIKADGTEILPIIYMDSAAPVLTLTDEDGNAAAVYETAADAAEADQLYNSYTLYVKSDEEVLGCVDAELKYAPKSGRSDVKTAAVLSTGAYLTSPVDGMCLQFDIPAGIDSVNYDIWLELTAEDTIYNKGTTTYYLAADTLAPTVEIIGDGLIETDGGHKAWEYNFSITDDASQDGSTLYYRFSDQEMFSDDDTDFTVVTEPYASDAVVSGIIEYYAVDGMGNRSVSAEAAFVMGDIDGMCEPLDAAAVSDKFLEPRAVEFTGFDAPTETESGVMVYDYLVYRIGVGGEYQAIRSENGEDLAIPAEELQRDCVIFYQMLSSSEEDLKKNLTEEYLSRLPQGELIYRCDNAAPGLEKELTLNHAGNAEYLKITAPADDHPQNIEKMEITLYNAGKAQIGETQDVTEHFVHNGVVLASISLENMLNRYNLPSGEYTMEVTLTDANGHSKTDTIFICEPIIKDAPVWDSLQILTENGDVVSGESVDGTVVIDEDLLREAASAGAFEDGFTLRAELLMRYEGSDFPDCDFTYSISGDGGSNWTEYTIEGSTVEKTVTSFTEGETYVCCVLKIRIPEQDGSSCLVKVKCSANPYVSDSIRVSTLNDIAAPFLSVNETAVGSDENGWSEVIDYTNDFVKLTLNAVDDGICPDALEVTITEVRDVDGNIVDKSDYDRYVMLDGDTVLVKENGRVIFTAMDAWGNTAEIMYICAWIDDIETGCQIYTDADTELYTYFTLKNYRDYVLAAVPEGETEISEEAIEQYKTLLEKDILVTESLASMAASRNGDLNTALRIAQRQLSDTSYDILCGVYDRTGKMEVYTIMTVVDTVEPIEAEAFTSSVTNLGNVVNAVQMLSFNKPVAQLDDDLVEEIIQNGYSPERGDIYMRELAFAETICAVIEDDNIRSETTAEVYVTDVYGQIAMVEVDITGTTFIDYGGYSVSCMDNGELVDDDHIFGKNSEITLTITGNDGVSILLPTGYADGVAVTTSGAVKVDSREYYSEVTLTLEAGMLDGEGYFHMADLLIRNAVSGEEYTDAIAVQYDTKGPVLVDAIEMLRHDSFDPGKVIYLFYDRREVTKIFEEIDGEYVEQISGNGIYYAQYLENTAPTVAAMDCDGNYSDNISGPVIDDVVVSKTLVEGVDFRLAATDEAGNALEEGLYYRTVLAEIQAIEGGKSFTAEPEGVVTITSESPVIFKLTDENGNKTVYQYIPPVDRTAPAVSVVQNNSGSLVAQIIYTITATDARSGVAKVYLPGAGADGEDIILEEEADRSGTYVFTTRNPDTFTLHVADTLGNVTEKQLSSNSAVVGELKVETTYHSKGLTNTGVRVSLKSDDGRRINSKVVSGTIPAADYIVSNNDFYIASNGELEIICSDEIGNETTAYIVVTNIDKTAPVIETTVSAVEDAYGIIDVTRARVSFRALSDGDDIPEKVFLLRRTEEEITFTDNTVWDECGGDLLVLWQNYNAEPEKYKYDEDFLEICDTLFRHDIYLNTTYADVTSNGRHTFYFVDSAGNTASATANVTIIDDIAPVVSSVKWKFSYLTGEQFDTLTPDSGTVTEENGLYLVDEELTGHLTNQPVTITITTEEPVVLYGGGSTTYSTSISKVFTTNGVYAFNLADKAGNICQVNVKVANILKRDIHISLNDPEDLVLIKGQEADYDLASLEGFTAYTYSGTEQVTITPAKSYIDYGGFDPENIADNTFDRMSPYVIRYKVWDEAGNMAELSRQVILCAEDDILVFVDSVLPDAAGNVYVTTGKASAEVRNYGDLPASVRLAKGQYNGAQMKTRGTVLTAVNGQYPLDFSEGEGWYTLYVRTLYQDLYVVRIYVKTGE